MKDTILDIKNEEAMQRLGRHLADGMPEGLIIYLQGDLGAGKTTLVRGILRAMGHFGAVKSPTFTIVEPYMVNSRSIYHFDLYRLTDPEELEYLGIRDYLHDSAVALIEWPEKGLGVLPQDDLAIIITHQKQGRQVKLIAHSDKGGGIVESIGSIYC